MSVPYIGVAPTYDRKGFHGFPERHDIDVEVLLSRASNSEDTFYTESLLQEWLWFGGLHEFATAYGLENDPISANSNFIKHGRPDVSSGSVVNTEPLLELVRAALVRMLQQQDVPLDLKPGDQVYIKSPIEPNPEGLLAGPFQIVEDLGNMLYSIDAGGGESLKWCAAHLKLDKSRGTSSGVTLSQKREKSIPLKVLSNMVMIQNIAGKPSTQPVRSQSRLARCLREVRETMNRILSHENPVLRLEVALSIDILCSSLVSVIDGLREEIVDLEMQSSFYLEAFSDRLKAQNWCLSRVELLLATDIIEMYIVSLLPSYESVSHVKCGAVACARRPQAVDQFSAKHRVDCGRSCTTMVFKERELIDILRADGIPGIAECHSEEGKVSYKIVDVTRRPFIAISHVWSHGLGNPAVNALPRCQIQYLFKLIKAMGRADAALWIDTISVPINPEYKRVSILKLRTVYRTASGVLVVDRHLQKVGTHWLEMRLQLLCSEWMRRLWTLQEGRLASRLYIQFRYQAVSVAELLKTDLKPHIQLDANIFGGLYLRTSMMVKTHFEKQDDISERFLDLAIDLSHRSVTVPSDEPICIATLLGLSLEDYSPLPTMADIYRSLPSLPQDLLFIETPRLQTAGLQWAPSTFLEQGLQDFPREQTAAIWNEQGLQVQKDCVMFDEGFAFRRDLELLAELYFIDCAESGKFVAMCCEPPVQQSRDLRAAAVIIQKSAKIYRNTSRAILVSNVTEDAGMFRCRFEMNLFTWRNNEAQRSKIEAMAKQPLRKACYSLSGTYHAQRRFIVS